MVGLQLPKYTVKEIAKGFEVTYTLEGDFELWIKTECW